MKNRKTNRLLKKKKHYCQSEIHTLQRKKYFQGGRTEMCTVHRNRTLFWRYSKSVYCAQKQNTFQTVHQKCVLCTEIKHLPDVTSEMCSVHRNRTLSRRYIRNVFCAQKHNTFHSVHQKCVLCIETQPFPDGTHKVVSRFQNDIKNGSQRITSFIYTNICN